MEVIVEIAEWQNCLIAATNVGNGHQEFEKLMMRRRPRIQPELQARIY